MPRASKSSPEKKIQVVLSVLRGEATAAEARRKAGPCPVEWWGSEADARCGQASSSA